MSYISYCMWLENNVDLENEIFKKLFINEIEKEKIIITHQYGLEKTRIETLGKTHASC
jgi:hypothetical protein